MLHHAHYKSTVYSTERSVKDWPEPHTLEEKEAYDVIDIDHKHFHVAKALR